ncbi:MAG: chemotaxis protein CheA [Rhodobacteraceae bacterium]|nr:MAG: chemotaxis protein CheA [Paracoccaceae bacterium]
MVHNNKVLTVSYGTFSCTLEGFDDSFGTMKAIAEYFRDLSSDDRYFGSEPPQPDAEMLARIAQREIARQVEAHSTGTGGIVLRATDAMAVAPAVVPAEPVAPAPDVADVVEPAAKVEPAVEAPAPPAPVVTPEPAPAAAVTEPEPAPTPVVEQEPDVADVVNAPEVETVTEAVTEATAEVAEEATPEDINPVDTGEETLVVADDAPQVEAEDVLQDDTPEPGPEPVSEQTVGDAPTPEAEPDMPVAEDVQEAKIVPAADSIAAKLQRIRAVVSQNDSLAPTDEYTEDEDSEGFVTAQLHNISEAMATEDETPDADDMTDVETQPGAIGAQPDQDAFGEDTYEVEEDIFADSPANQDDATFDAPDTRSDLTGEVPDDPDQDAPKETTLTGDDAPVQARVVKVKRADLEAAIATGQFEQIDDDAPDADTDADAGTAPEPAVPFVDSSLSPEDEDELMRELAAVEEDLSFADNEQEADDNIFGDDIVSEVVDAPEPDPDLNPVQEQAQNESAQNALSQSVSEDEGDVSRLMEAADEKLDDPETSSQRDTYSHLRAAVAAAEAEKTAGGSIDDKTEDDAYRDDLANVVRPRRTAIEGNRHTRRIPDTRPAPLKLVAEQRVDEGASQVQRGAVRPRRVLTPAPEAANLSDATGTDSAFADFANRVGATELPDLLEAAAAYLSFVEGQEKFSRPQLMNKVRLVKQDAYNREDGLRSFGQLLRDGKIEKRGGGRFAASGEIGFRPDDTEREAG